MKNNKIIRAIELFAGVGGFKLGLEKNNYKVVWSNQWEPSTKRQHASETYSGRFGEENHSCDDIAQVNTKDIPPHDLLVGGFPCQDYSVARTLSHAHGLEGKKGVLWWEIHRIVKEKNTKYLFLENVDRLLKSPSKMRGRDFAVMLWTLNDLGYIVEWRVVNAADYGMPQRRRRVFILAYKKNTSLYKEAKKGDKLKWILKDGVFAKAFPIHSEFENKKNFELDKDVVDISNSFNKGSKQSLFENSGVMVNGEVLTVKAHAKYSGKRITLGDIILPDSEVSEEFFIDEKSLEEWNRLKGAKKEKRVTKEGFEYWYSEGGMVFPDALDKPSRTIVTGEGGTSPSRFKHVIKSPESGRLRRLTPVELERLNMFPDNHTVGQTDTKRAFFMGNALVVGVIQKIGKELEKRILE